ncbi:OmpH family outer membrane protein [Wenxinia marina]|uniref:Periplasmic chaperone for outer membrane protein Skp n=1 Tax=Wenxinia marina DSM 24838 TaxID=1123501 RepID=A0A0D0PZF6_9RHOB|nr:OmpH family outer membrane protein [Wenxinia marina]KIQ67719.1 periplasmic chaperone for outer membrane protein Skp [Wenxinia marina DSM 24838]GGL77713.1 hypothetical protein GCM10011392_35280 [Wenxinia marina]
MRRAVRSALALAALLAGAPGLPARAQDQTTMSVTDSLPLQGPVRSPVLTIDLERLYAGSDFGERVAADIRAATEALAAENRQIEAELTAEEQSLTDRRPTMEPEAFRAEAEAFAERVQTIRREQDAKERALQDRLVAGRDAFFAAATPVLGRMMLDAGAAVILDRRNVFLGVGLVDITDSAIQRIDAEVGDGASEAPAPDTGSDPAPGPAAPAEQDSAPPDGAEAADD